MPWRKPIRAAWANLAVIALLLAAVSTALAIHWNNERVTDLQNSRVASCRQTYNSFHLVFNPFLTPKRQRTAKQERTIRRFNRTIDRLVKGCGVQTRPRKENQP